ncbi:RNA methyltransferase [Candidatus Woesearchaeota archaeon]|nr:RNA methyltransferase [Candidatus Woesearchaeota archaeon]
MLYVILIEPENPGNIGAIARVMKNFGFKNLVLINPVADISSSEAICRAKHAQDVLKRAIVADWSFLDKMDYLAGTTAKLGTDYNIPRSPLTPDKLAEKANTKKKLGLVIGREGKGLSNKEIGLCDFIVTIPAQAKYPTLNISHALGILLYEIYKINGKDRSDSHIETAGRRYKDVLNKRVAGLLEQMEFATPEKKQTQKVVWKRIFGKAMLTKREAFAVLGLFSKIEKGLKR